MVVLWCALFALVCGLAGCGGPVARDTAAAEVQRLLDRRADAVLDRDETAYLATGQDGVGRAEFENLEDVPLSSWEYRLTRFDRSGSRATAAVDLRYRLDGYDRGAVDAARTLRLEHRDGRWYVTSDRPAKDTAEQLWEQGPVRVVRGAHSLVLGVAQDEKVLRRYAGLADRAVPAVQDAWGGAWAGRVVVLVPRSLDGMGELLGAPASGYRGIAAVTTGEVGGAGKAPADRIVINPEAFGVLSAFGRQVVLTHETTHVATRAHTSAATPLWLSEGYADWVGYRGTGRTAEQAAPELARAVRAGRLPGALPDDEDFRFGGDAQRLAEAYEGGWLACRMIARDWGEEKLNAFYRAVGAHKERRGAVEDALRDVLEITPAGFTARWRDYLRAEVGA
ncbi:hypothetical protein STSP_42680 [Streptomyces jeddahensis]|uniref:Lipoprotein n=2 Tax=Streptomyces jeddahensis TaxID=1716141 RepID=A0A177HMZ4_9ACTN|nr:hypothetical protein STSP_42680 [Streptomyces jeddahensis]